MTRRFEDDVKRSSGGTIRMPLEAFRTHSHNTGDKREIVGWLSNEMNNPIAVIISGDAVNTAGKPKPALPMPKPSPLPGERPAAPRADELPIKPKRANDRLSIVASAASEYQRSTMVQGLTTLRAFVNDALSQAGLQKLTDEECRTHGVA